MKVRLFLLFLIMIEINPAVGQGGQLDSLKLMMLAKADAKKFRYNMANKKQVNQNLKNPNSDFFKPTRTFASNPELLKDSVYVNAFKKYAVKKTKSRRTSKTVLYVANGVLILFFAVVATAFLRNPL